MRASVLIAAHDEGVALIKTLRACQQTVGDLDHEVIVADDASTDDSAQEVSRLFPHARLTGHKRRRGASPTKHLAATEAAGDVLVFLDGHCNPQPGAIRRLVEDVEALDGQAIITPAVPTLDVAKWQNSPSSVGHGFTFGLEKFDCRWTPLSRLRAIKEGRRRFYETPALIGCVFAISRELYGKLRGFDPHMFYWGFDDLDLGFKSWLLGHPVLHDPEAVVGHRFRRTFDNYDVPFEHVTVNKLRMARKNFTPTIWAQWLERCRERSPKQLKDHPEGFWARVWELFKTNYASIEEERRYLQGLRERDEFWFAERFGLDWPRVQPLKSLPMSFLSFAEGEEPSPSPPPQPDPLGGSLQLDGSIELVTPCKDLTLPGYPANSAINLKAKFSLKTLGMTTYDYRLQIHAINKETCEELAGSALSQEGKAEPGAPVSLPLEKMIMETPAGLYEFRASIQTKPENAQAYTLFVLRTCLFKAGNPNLVGATGQVTARAPCGTIASNVPVGGDSATCRVLKDDSRNHHLQLQTTIWNRSTGQVVYNAATPLALKPDETNNVHVAFLKLWPQSHYQHFVELRDTSLELPLCQARAVLQRLQCAFESVPPPP